MNSGGHSDDPSPEFHTTIATFIDALLDDIADLASFSDDDPRRATADRVITIKERAVQHLQGFLHIDGWRPVPTLHET